MRRARERLMVCAHGHSQKLAKKVPKVLFRNGHRNARETLVL
jgi:hypothetical protein